MYNSDENVFKFTMQRERDAQRRVQDFFHQGQILFLGGQNRVRREFGLHPHGIASFFLKLDLLSPGAGFIPITSTKVINQIKKDFFKRK